MENLLSQFYSFASETLILLFSVVFVIISKKVSSYLEKLKQKDTLDIIDFLTDRAVELVEKELKDKNNEEKKQKAIELAKEFLNARKINVSDEELLSGIENGVNKLKSLKRKK